MKTGAKRRVHHRVSACVAVALTVALPLALTACDDHSPVAAPTSTLPAQDSADSPSGEAESPSVPEYETELDLNDEEKEAVEGALVALLTFVDFTNRLYEAGGQGVDEASNVATGDSLEEVKAAAESMVNDSKSMVGEVTVTQLNVDSVTIKDKTKPVEISACSPSDTYHFVTPGTPSPSAADHSNPQFKFTIILDEDSWKVAKQDWTREECDS